MSPCDVESGPGAGGSAAVPWPRAISDDRGARVLRIEWQDGTESALPHRCLRARCRCAACSQLARAGGSVEADQAVALTDIRPVAEQGLNLVFSDGHGRGIYPWTYLRELGEVLAEPSRADAMSSDYRK